MRQLDTCDFCGEQPEGVYEVVPESLGGGPQRLALCASCRETLQSVVDPLLDAAASGSPDGSSPDGGRAPGPQAAQPTETADRTAESPAETAGQNPEPTSASTANRADQPDIAMPSASESSDAATTDESMANESTADESMANESASGESTADESTTDESTADESTTNESASGESTADEPAQVPKPDGYGQVLRLLQNRDDAMARADLRALATNAYDLGERTVEEAVDAAIENGDVEETADGLRTL